MASAVRISNPLSHFTKAAVGKTGAHFSLQCRWAKKLAGSPQTLLQLSDNHHQSKLANWTTLPELLELPACLHLTMLKVGMEDTFCTT